MWKTEAERLFFNEGKSIVEIAERIKISRQSIAAHLSTCSGFAEEKTRRKEKNTENRKYKKMIWARDARTEAAVLRREHEMAVKELSAERYH